jgi:hypothetical protein
LETQSKICGREIKPGHARSVDVTRLVNASAVQVQ